MAKEAYYFSHDYGARNDPKLQKVLMKLGQEGKGVYWDLVEMLFEEGGKLLLCECDSYAFALRTTKVCINSLLSDFDLFKKDRKYFWSNSVLKRIKERDEKSEKAKASANFRWKNANALKNDTTAVRFESDSNAIKESKGKEKKVIIDYAVAFSFFSTTRTRRELTEKYKIDTDLKFKEFYNMKVDLGDFNNKTKEEIIKHFSNWLPTNLLIENDQRSRNDKGRQSQTQGEVLN